MFEVNSILIKALIKLLQRKIYLNNMYIPAGCLMPVRHSDIFLSSPGFHRVTHDKETRPTSTICSVNERLL